ncbi:MAG: aspartate carbamoyltransferase [Candidatus Moraniibacteriota bacterium]
MLKRLGSIIEAQQFDEETLGDIFRIADEMQEIDYYPMLTGKIVISLFYEASTRTRFSFESAAKRLGAEVISTENARAFSSAFKGETLEDAVRVVSRYGHLIVLRYDKEGGAKRAQQFARIPIINAGDGPGQHPTQALLDVYTMIKKFGKLEGLNIALVGDLRNGRTVRSLCYLFARHFPKNKIWLVSPGLVQMRDDIKEVLTRYQVEWFETDNMDEILEKVDILYQTRVQTERVEDQVLLEKIQREAEQLYLNMEKVERMKKDAIILHPLPRKNEIRFRVDQDPRAWYFKQSDNGVPIRMALLKMMLIGY